jgi:hypothetical protein
VARGSKASDGALVSYVQSVAATATATVYRASVGRRAGASCRKAASPQAGGRKCTRFTRVGGFKYDGPVGRVSFRFSGRIDGASLAPGPYRLAVVAEGRGMGPSSPATASLRIVR